MFTYVSIIYICFHICLIYVMVLVLVLVFFFLNHIVLSYSFCESQIETFPLAFVLVIFCVHDNYNVLTTIQNIATTYKIFENFVYQASLQWNYFYSYKCVGGFLTKAKKIKLGQRQ
jgi:hypothetical protein